MEIIRRCFACVILAFLSYACARGTDTHTSITWRQNEDEIILYIDFSKEASAELTDLLNRPVTFEQVRDFLVQHTDGEIPFFEGALTAAALKTRSADIKVEMEKKLSQDGITLEIIGFKENPVQIMKGALKFSQAPKYLVDFDPAKHPEIVNELIDLMGGHEFVVEIYGRFPKQ